MKQLTTIYSNLILMLLSLVLLLSCGGSGSGNNQPLPVEGTIISQFSFLTANNPELPADLVLNIDGQTITGRISVNISVENLIATFAHNGSQITVNGQIQNSGTTANDFTQILTYTVSTSDGRQQNYTLDLTRFTGLPVIYLRTDGNLPIESRDEYIYGDVEVDGGRNFNDFPDSGMKIRGRGHSTWGVHPKKPYQMKLSDKAEFLGMPEDKKWIFLAEYSDKTMLRNTIAFEMGYISNLDWTPLSRFAEVYVNGEYNGTYNISQKVEDKANRVNLGGTGYLLEIDQLERLDVDDVYINTNSFVLNIKEPDLLWHDDQYQYINNLINEFETALFSDHFTDPLTGYGNYIDLDSFIDWFLISEITKNVDSQFYSSIYLNVMPGGMIKMGPLWDFDLAFGNVDYADSRYAEGFWVKYNPWYNRLFQDPAFVEKVQQRFIHFMDNMDFILDKIDSHANYLQWAQQENDNKWQTIGIYVWPNPMVYNTYQGEVDHLKNWYVRRMNWLQTALNNL